MQLWPNHVQYTKLNIPHIKVLVVKAQGKDIRFNCSVVVPNMQPVEHQLCSVKSFARFRRNYAGKLVRFLKPNNREVYFFYKMKKIVK
jgi:hypothetical protein